MLELPDCKGKLYNYTPKHPEANQHGEATETRSKEIEDQKRAQEQKQPREEERGQGPNRQQGTNTPSAARVFGIFSWWPPRGSRWEEGFTLGRSPPWQGKFDGVQDY